MRLKLKLPTIFAAPAFAFCTIFTLTVYADYDYFKNAQLPGVRRPDVSLDQVTDEAPADGVPTAYQRRRVEWWPQKGVDIVDIPKGAPLRTWTINPEVKESTWWPLSLRDKKQFKAHLIGFRGIGLGIGNPWKGNSKYFCPAVVLRLEDGRKRCFVRDAFIEADELYICKIYECEMQKLRDNTFEKGFKRTVSPDDLKGYPRSELYKPGATHIDTEHFVALMGTEDPQDKAGSLWLINKDKEMAARNRMLIMRGWEDWWAYLEYAGQLMPYWEKTSEKRKIKISIGGTKKNGSEIMNRGNGGSYGGLTTPNGNWWALFHEWHHGRLNGGMISLGGGETMCDAAQIVGDPKTIQKMMFQVVKPWKNLFWGAYPGAYGWANMGDNPNWGYAAVSTIPSLMTSGEHTPMHAIARLGENRGIFKNGIRGMGDMMGQIGARMAEFDTELQAGLRAQFTMPSRIYLDALDEGKRLYRSPLFFSPEPFGVNIIRLKPDAGAREVTVDFMGHYDPATYSDWRVCIVAVDAEGHCRYSPLWNKGEMSLAVKPGDRRYWLTVTATPYALSPSHPTGAQTVWTVYQGSFAYKYPYDVQFFGCRPGSPHTTLIEDDVLGTVGADWGKLRGEGARVASVPAIEGTGAYTQIQQAHQTAPSLAARPGSMAYASIIEKHLHNGQGRPHPNGGGWVANSAHVDATAYVAPNAMVLDGAHVLDHAVINDYAVISGPRVTIEDNARVYHHTIVEDKTGARTYSGGARVYRQDELKGDVELDKPQQRGSQWKSEDSRFADLDYRLQANYECDVPETVLLEDYYKEHSTGVFFYGAHRSDQISFDGVLKGKPGFERLPVGGALTFNGKDQYAEVPGVAADLEEITLDLKFMALSRREQTLYEFGSTPSDWFRLSLKGGLLNLETSKKGILLSTKAPASWVNCRVELDGKTASMWINGKKEATKQSNFRASQVYLPGKERLGTLCAGRNGAKPLKGSVDYFRIYTTVYSDFSDVPVPLIASRRIAPDFIERFNRAYPTVEEDRAELLSTKGNDLDRFYTKYIAAIDSRLTALRNTPSAQATSLWEEAVVLKKRLDRLIAQKNNAMQNDNDFAARKKAAAKERMKYQQELDALKKGNAEYMATVAEVTRIENKNAALLARANKRAKEELSRNPEYTRLSGKITSLQEKIKTASKDKNNMQRLTTLLNAMRKSQQGMAKQLLMNDPETKAAVLEVDKVRDKMRDLNNTFNRKPDVKTIMAKMRDAGQVRFKADKSLTAEISKLQVAYDGKMAEFNLAKDMAAIKANPAECRALRLTFYHCRRYHKFIPQALIKTLLIISDDIDQVKKAWNFQKQKWHVKVDWDGRAPYELEPESVEQPVMQHYLKKMKPWMYE